MSELIEQDEKAAISSFVDFLMQRKLMPKDSDLASGALSLYELINKNFQYLSDVNLRQLIDEALRFRDQKASVTENITSQGLLGAWGLIIDTVKVIITERRELAGKNFQTLVAYGMQGEPELVNNLLRSLHSQGLLDHLFWDILTSTYEAMKRSTTDKEDHRLFMLEYFMSFIQELKGQTPSASSNRTPLQPESDKVSTKAVTTSTAGSNRSDEEVSQLIKAGQLLVELITDNKGKDIKALETQLLTCMLQGKVDSYFMQALQDNLVAAEAANYENKTKLLRHMKHFIEEQRTRLEMQDNDVIAQQLEGMSTYHAPKFVDSSAMKKEVRLVSADEISFIDATKAGITEKIKNKKKKQEKKAAKQKVQTMLDVISEHLDDFSWAVIDNVLPLDLVRRVRIEASLFKDHYEQSEIWVGKRADIGAHVRVPSVRGDQVLWMCGGHQSDQAVEGISRVVRTYGEIEPCKLEIKAAAPIRRFNALKEAIAICDKLVYDLKKVNPSLSGIFERSDAMLSIYPGEGARFARHVDNTTQDGRRLTLIMYFNPGWTEDKGGALRITDAIDVNKTSIVDDASTSSTGETTTTTAVDVSPIAGRVVMFMSSSIPHEVLPTFGERHAMTLWYYDQGERSRAVERAREAGGADAAAKASPATQAQAKEFIAELMGGDEVGEDGGEPTAEELSALASKVVSLSDDALDIVASITGAPSTKSFRDGFAMLTPTDLKSMRALFRRMGLKD